VLDVVLGAIKSHISTNKLYIYKKEKKTCHGCLLSTPLSFKVTHEQKSTEERLNVNELRFFFSCRAWHAIERERNKQGGMKRMHEGE